MSPRISAYRAPRRYTRFLQCYTTEEQWAEMVELAARRDISVSKLLREIVTEYLKVNSVRTEEFLDQLVVEQKARTAELEASGNISMTDAQDHVWNHPNRELDPNCATCIEIRKQYPEA